MEMRKVIVFVHRWWWLPVGLALVVAILSTLLARPWVPKPTSYAATMKFSVGLKPERVPGVYTYDRYYTMLTSEYLVDDLGEIVRSGAFTSAVSKRLSAQGITLPAGAIGSSTQPGKLHRILTLSVGWGDARQLAAISDAIAATLTQGTAEFFGQFSAEEADIRLIDPPVVSQVGRPAREQLDIPLRVLLGFLAGLGLAIVFHYFDRTIYGSDELTDLGLPLLAEVPRFR
jgi:capsular polysaccharide biosynthesis protein